MTVRKARADALAAVAAMRRDEDREPTAPRAPGRSRPAASPVAAFAERWLAEYVRPQLKPRTIADYERLIEQRIGPALGHLIVSRVAKEDVLKLHAKMQATPRAEDCGLRPPMTNPARRIKMYRERPRERFLSEDEIGKAAEAITAAERAGKVGPYVAAALRLALFTGARSGELTAAQWIHVDWDRKLIRLPDSKTNEPRTIHLSDAALEILKTLPRVGKFIIAGAKQDESYKNLSRAWMVAREFGGLSDVRLHDPRHSYASLAAGRGVSLQMIGKLLGHRASATTQLYAHPARDVVAAVNDELGAAMTICPKTFRAAPGPRARERAR